MESSQSIMLAVTLLAFLLYGEGHSDCSASGLSGPTASGAANSTNTNTSGKPYWHRPGCHRVGHTRTISIPGCVKFNLSTNACRGFCMSFSIPTADDIGAGSTNTVMEFLDGPARGASGGKDHAGSRHALNTLLGGGSSLSPQARPLPTPLVGLLEPNKKLEANQREALTPDVSTALLLSQLGDLSSNKNLDKFNSFWHLSGQRSPLAGAVGYTGDKKDVISVSQCCNMMETEDVTVNLRCGLNETRRLVFKSAKTCECFFCKHV